MDNINKTACFFGIVIPLACFMFGLPPGYQFLTQVQQTDVQFGNRRTHFVAGEPVVAISPLVNQQNEILGAVVQLGSYEEATFDGQLIDSPESPQTNGAATTTRTMLLNDDCGIHLIANSQWSSLDLQELAGGPFIYYLNEDEPFRKIPIAETQLEPFKSALLKQHPPEFVAQWCDKQPGQSIAGDRSIPIR